MSTLSRKQLLLSKDNVSRLSELSDRYRLSESELVRRAIQAYDPDNHGSRAAPSELSSNMESMFTQIDIALNAALDIVEAANQRVMHAMERLESPEERASIIEDVRQELADNPLLLDEIANLVNEDALYGKRS